MVRNGRRQDGPETSRSAGRRRIPARAAGGNGAFEQGSGPAPEVRISSAATLRWWVTTGSALSHTAAKGSRHGRITWPQRDPVIGLQNGQIEHISLNLLRTVCGLRGVAPHLTCTNASIQTLKRNSTTSPSAMT